MNARVSGEVLNGKEILTVFLSTEVHSDNCSHMSVFIKKLCVYVFVYVCVCVHVFVCTYICVCVCLCIHACVRIT